LVDFSFFSFFFSTHAQKPPSLQRIGNFTIEASLSAGMYAHNPMQTYQFDQVMRSVKHRHCHLHRHCKRRILFVNLRLVAFANLQKIERASNNKK
jgi:hypothetical protein